VLEKPSLTLRRQKLKVLDRFDGRLTLRFKGRDMEYRQVQEVRRPAPRPVVVKIKRRPPKYAPHRATPGGTRSSGTDRHGRTGSFRVAENRVLSFC